MIFELFVIVSRWFCWFRLIDYYGF